MLCGGTEPCPGSRGCVPPAPPSPGSSLPPHFTRLFGFFFKLLGSKMGLLAPWCPPLLPDPLSGAIWSPHRQSGLGLGIRAGTLPLPGALPWVAPPAPAQPLPGLLGSLWVRPRGDQPQGEPPAGEGPTAAPATGDPARPAWVPAPTGTPIPVGLSSHPVPAPPPLCPSIRPPS